MRIPTGVPIGLVAKIIGPQGFREIDMILDTGGSVYNYFLGCSKRHRL